MGLFLIKEIKSKEGVVHFRRWRIIETPWFSVYIHGIYKADEDEDMHDHPWDYASLVLSGFYSEQTIGPDGKRVFNIRAPFKFIKRKAEQIHKIDELYTTKVFTLFFTGPRKREWGYGTKQGWIDNIQYRKNKHGKQKEQNS